MMMMYTTQAPVGDCSSAAKMLFAILAGVLATGSVARATTFTTTAPTAGGTFKLGVKTVFVTCEPITVPIAADDTAAQKATKIATAIEDQCLDTVFTATANGSQVTITESSHPNAKVFIKIVSDDTGEKDTIEKELTPSWWNIFGNGSLYVCVAPASGKAWNGDAGSITVGTPTHVATIPTEPGLPPVELLSVALSELNANGVTNVVLELLPDGAAQLRFLLDDNDAWIQVGADDTGVGYSFEMTFTPPSVPTASEWSLIVMTVLMFTVATVVIGRRRSAAA